jgi:hypothetical protein
LAGWRGAGCEEGLSGGGSTGREELLSGGRSAGREELQRGVALLSLGQDDRTRCGGLDTGSAGESRKFQSARGKFANAFSLSAEMGSDWAGKTQTREHL